HPRAPSRPETGVPGSADGRCPGPRRDGGAGAGGAPGVHARRDDPAGAPGLPGRPARVPGLSAVRPVPDRPADPGRYAAAGGGLPVTYRPMISAGPFIPLPQIVAEFVAGIRLALFGANARVRLRP